MKKILKYLLFLLILAFAARCKEPYDPPSLAGENGYLVVDGIIVNTPGQTVIRLSRTTSWHDSVNVEYEQNALVQVEGADHSVFNLPEKNYGQYIGDSLQLNPGIEYRLKIKTSKGQTYVSDFVPVLDSPPVDSISWRQNPDAGRFGLFDLAIFINTHDPNNNTHYYLWNYVETWKYRSPIVANVIYKNFGIYTITKAEQNSLYNCWQSVNSESILIGNSSKLSQDVISMQPITSIKGNSLKKSYAYSININQYAITLGAYKFYETMKKNSEQTGSLFDPQPAAIKGNIKNVDNPSEPVVGYVSASTVSMKRIFITKNMFYYYSSNCVLQYLYTTNIDNIQYPSINYPVDFLLDTYTHKLIGYIIAPSSCVNCALMGGKSIQPVFWPDSL